MQQLNWIFGKRKQEFYEGKCCTRKNLAGQIKAWVFTGVYMQRSSMEN